MTTTTNTGIDINKPTIDATATNGPRDENELYLAEMPYAQVQPTPNTGGNNPTLPPIATARPLGNLQPLHHTQADNHIPANNAASMPPRGLFMAGAPMVMETNMRFNYMDKCRWVAGVMLAYYIGTFFFVQPFFMGVLGITTGFLGYYGARTPMDATRMKWIRAYTWLNYVMIALNIWLLVICLVFVGRDDMDVSDDGSSNTYAISMNNSSSYLASDENSHDDDSNYYYYTHHLGLLVAIVVAANLVFHVHGLRTAQFFYAELVSCGLFTSAVIVMANPV